jgi:transposase InsO family protein
MSDNASEFRSASFQATIAKLKARHTFIRAGRPQTMRVDWRLSSAPLGG